MFTCETLVTNRLEKVSTKPKTYGFYLLLTCLSFKLKEALTFFPPIFLFDRKT